MHSKGRFPGATGILRQDTGETEAGTKLGKFKTSSLRHTDMNLYLYHFHLSGQYKTKRRKDEMAVSKMKYHQYSV